MSALKVHFFKTYFLVLTLASSITFGIGFEYGIFPIFGTLIMLFLTDMTSKVYQYLLPLFILVTIALLNLMLSNSDISLLIKQIFWILAFFVGIWSKDYGENLPHEKIVFVVLIFAILDYAGLTHGFKDFFFSRVVMPSGSRGATSLFTEPSYLALALICIIALNRNLTLRMEVLAMVILVLSKSTMALFGFLLLFYNSKRRILYVSLLILALLFLSESDIRFVAFIKAMISGDLLGNLDASGRARLAYIIRDIGISKENLFIGFGPGSFSRLVSRNPALNSDYDPFMAGSLLGTLLVEYGVLVCYPIYKFVRVIGIFRTIVFICVGLQMISFAFLFFPFTLGKLLSKNCV